jgi:ribosomal protein S18 acetylase RimI-like enzyme
VIVGQREMTLRRLSPLDATEYRRLRLRGLRESPTAFGSSYAEEVKRPLKAFVARLEQTPTKWTFGAFENERLVGVVTLIREEKRKEKHKASIFGMYVDRKERRKGVGRELLNFVLEAARRMRGLKQLRLAVVEGNRPARCLYEGAGFKTYGREEAALCVAGKFYSELFLVRKP